MNIEKLDSSLNRAFANKESGPFAILVRFTHPGHPGRYRTPWFDDEGRYGERRGDGRSNRKAYRSGRRHECFAAPTAQGDRR